MNINVVSDVVHANVGFLPSCPAASSPGTSALEKESTELGRLWLMKFQVCYVDAVNVNAVVVTGSDIVA
jgi:hypothetical protein